MKKFTLLFIAVMALSLTTKAQTDVWDGTSVAWTQGNGSEATPYLIESAENLAYLATIVNNGTANAGDYYKLTCDIDLNGSETFQWIPIGNTSYSFQGNFNGDNHTISNLYINTSILQYVGLFGAASNAEIDSVGVAGESNISSVCNKSYSGAIVGCVKDTVSITNCYNASNVYGYYSSGGIVGYNNSTATITNCYNTGNISISTSTSGYGCGGMIGYNNSTATITNCYNTGNIFTSGYGSGYGSGGMIGYNLKITTIANCYNTGAISGRYSGGIVGYSRNADTITNCYNIGILSAYNYIGGIIGRNNAAPITTNCYYLNTCDGDNTYGTPMAESAMKTSAFVTTLNGDSSAFVQDVSPYVNQGYPIFNNIIYLNAQTITPLSISQSKATLKGYVSARNTTITEKGLEYKTINDEDYITVCSTGNDTISAIISGLTPNTKYIFRSYAKADDVAIMYGDTVSFTTLPVTATTLEATSVERTGAVLNGKVSFGDASIDEMGFSVWNDSYDTLISLSGTDSILSYTLNGLSKSTTYKYKTYAAYADTTVYGGDITFTTEAWNSNGTQYLIEDSADLVLLAELVGAGESYEGETFILANDIELASTSNNILSIGSYPNYPFSGTFDGNEKLIYNVYIDKPNTAYQGFFGYTKNAYIYNVGLVNITASGRNYTGGLVAYAQNTDIRNSYVNGGSLYALSYVGGLVGYQTSGENSIISGCYNTCDVSGNNSVGGLLGYSDEGTVRNSYVAASVSGQGTGVGSIIGTANDVLSYYCYYNDSITGVSVAIGDNNISESKSATIVGNSEESSEQSNDDGNMSGSEMKTQSFVNTLNKGLATTVWVMDYETQINNGYPILYWQEGGNATGTDDGVPSETDALSLKIYPNPTMIFTTLEVEGLEDDAYIIIYNINGREVKRLTIDKMENVKNIDVSGFTKGIYFVKAVSNGYISTTKLIVI